MEHLVKGASILCGLFLCRGALGAIILIDHASHSALMALEFYLTRFKEYTHNIVIGITHVDEIRLESSADIYHQWLAENEHVYPLFFIDGRDKKDILLLAEALIVTGEAHMGCLS